MKNVHLIGLASMLFLVAACGAASDTDADQALDETPASDEAELKSRKKKKTCASVGGSCVGLAPSSCAGGSWADAKQVSCGAGIGVGCCVPPPAPAPANACEAAGGTCVGLAPSSCAAGKWADASTHSCGGGIGAGCCLR